VSEAPLTFEHLGRSPALLVRIGGAAVVVTATTGVATGGLPGWEKRLFAILNGGPVGTEAGLWLPMQAGSLFGPFVIGGVVWRRWRQWRPAAGAAVAGVVAWQLAKVLKAAVDRGRPFEMVEGFAERAGTPHEGLGFVSGHSAVAFSVAAVLSPYLSRRWRVGAYALALVVGLARIQVSAHLPLDVVGGGALGYGLGKTWNLAVGEPAVGPPGTE
jgi:membrane-associated phospholipid phosphatase